MAEEKDKTKRPIVVKRIKKVAAGHHGGAWKIAYADFVTAMMAFFLLMWLLGSTSKGTQQGIADYFKTPLRVSLGGGEGSGDSSSVIKGGGESLTRSNGQVKKGDTPSEKKMINIKAATQEFLRVELEKLKALKATIEKKIDDNPALKNFKNQVRLDITSDGLRIQIVDDQNRPMFQNGRAQLETYTIEILHELGKTLNEVPNKISLSGHTDALTYSGGNSGYSNWELSSDRANASRRELIAGGLLDDKIVRVIGMSSSALFNPADPLDPANRRISIIIMNQKAAETAKQDGGSVDLIEDKTVIVGSVDEVAGMPAAAASLPVATIH